MLKDFSNAECNFQRRRYWSFVLLLSVFLTATSFDFLSYAESHSACPLIHRNPIAVFIDPTDQEIEKMKKEMGEEDFYVMADDHIYYRYNAQEYLKRVGFPFCFSNEEKHSFLGGGSKKISFEKTCRDWSVMLWNGRDKPLCASAVDVLQQEEYLQAGDEFLCGDKKGHREVIGKEPTASILYKKLRHVENASWPDPEEFWEETFTYVGEARTRDGRIYKIGRLSTTFGAACRASNRLFIFDGKNNCLGQYYGIADLPTEIKGATLYFPYPQEYGNQLDLENGPPWQAWLDGQNPEWNPARRKLQAREH